MTERKTLSLSQKETGYRYNRDSFLLADFFNPADIGSLLDLGAGVGVVSILIGMENPHMKITALEINADIARIAAENARNSGLHHYHALAGDMMTAASLFCGVKFGAVVSNPPYRKKGSGRINPDPAKAAARHELKMTMAGLVKASAMILADGGSLSLTMIFERREEYLKELASKGFYESRARLVQSFENSEPILFLSEARFGVRREFAMEPPLVLKSETGGDSPEFNKIIERYGAGKIT